MFFGSGTFYKMVVKDDGSPNWTGITILVLVLILTFVWRCMVFIQEYWVAVRLRFNRVVRDKDGNPLEYDPLAVRPVKPIERWQLRRRLMRQVRRWRGRPEPTTKKTGGIRFRFYLLNSLRLVNCGRRETDLGIDAITLVDMDFDTSVSVEWNVSRASGNPTKSFLRPAETKWRWKGEKDELTELVRSRCADAVLRAYEEVHQELERGNAQAPHQLPMLDFETNPHLMRVKEYLLEEYGSETTGLLYKRRSVSPARRGLEGHREMAAANREVAAAIRGDVVPPPSRKYGSAAAAAVTNGNVIDVDFRPPSA